MAESKKSGYSSSISSVMSIAFVGITTVDSIFSFPITGLISSLKFDSTGDFHNHILFDCYKINISYNVIV